MVQVRQLLKMVEVARGKIAKVPTVFANGQTFPVTHEFSRDEQKRKIVGVETEG